MNKDKNVMKKKKAAGKNKGRAYLKSSLMEDVVLQSYNMETREDLHEELSFKFGFPEYYGKNLDALNDLLGEWDRKTLVLLFGEEKVRKNLKEYGDTFISVLRNACRENPNLFLYSEDAVKKAVFKKI